MLQKGASPNATWRGAGGGLDTLLHRAVRLDSFALVDQLVCAGVTLEVPSRQYNSTPLRYAIQHKQKRILSYLIEMGIDLSFNFQGETVLTWMVKTRTLWKILPLLFQSVARSEKDRLCGHNSDGLNALQVALDADLDEPMHTLITFGYPVEAPTASGIPSLHFTVLHLSINCGCYGSLRSINCGLSR